MNDDAAVQVQFVSVIIEKNIFPVFRERMFYHSSLTGWITKDVETLFLWYVQFINKSKDVYVSQMVHIKKWNRSELSSAIKPIFN